MLLGPLSRLWPTHPNDDIRPGFLERELIDYRAAVVTVPVPSAASILASLSKGPDLLLLSLDGRMLLLTFVQEHRHEELDLIVSTCPSVLRATRSGYTWATSSAIRPY